MKTTYRRIADGEWVTPRRRNHRLRCCDCGLVHRVDFRVRDSRIQFRAFRDARATAATLERRSGAMKEPQ